MRRKHPRMTLLVALGFSPGMALAAPGPGLQNKADSLEELMKFLPMVMGPMFLLRTIMFMFSGNSGHCVEREASAEIPASVPSSVERLQEAVCGPDQVAIAKTDLVDRFNRKSLEGLGGSCI